MPSSQSECQSQWTLDEVMTLMVIGLIKLLLIEILFISFVANAVFGSLARTTIRGLTNSQILRKGNSFFRYSSVSFRVSRPDFYVGHIGYELSDMNCFYIWMCDRRRQTLSVHFQTRDAEVAGLRSSTVTCEVE